MNADGTTTIAAPSNIIKSGTAVASTSGTSVDFTGIPSWVKRVTVMFNGVSTNGTSLMLIQIGAGSITTTGYKSHTGGIQAAGVFSQTSTAGFIIFADQASLLLSGLLTIATPGSNIWLSSGALYAAVATPFSAVCSGSGTLSGTLDRVRITTVGGTDTFDAGSINLLWEG